MAGNNPRDSRQPARQPRQAPATAESMALENELNRRGQNPDAELAGLQQPRRQRRQAPMDPERVGSSLAIQMVRHEQDMLARTRGAQVPRDRFGFREAEEAPRRPVPVIPRRRRNDRTAAVWNGQPLVRQGWVARWVRQVDDNNRPTQERVEEFLDDEYEIVLWPEGHPEAGQPVTSIYGVLMQAPPANYAARVLHRSPTGAFTRDAAMAQARETIQRVNRRAGVELLRPYEAPDHGTDRTVEPVYSGEIDNPTDPVLTDLNLGTHGEGSVDEIDE